MQGQVWTVGHSNRSLDDLLSLLASEAISMVADVRRFPASRRHPQFNRDAFEAALSKAGIGYRHFEALGGRRHERAPDSPNTAWRVEAFNAYADHMQTPEFLAAFHELTSLADKSRTTILCAEALPWQCHRRLIADLLIARGRTVYDIIGPGKARPHQLTEWARVADGRVTYPAEPLFG